jgi:hypothetical protein
MSLRVEPVAIMSWKEVNRGIRKASHRCRLASAQATCPNLLLLVVRILAAAAGAASIGTCRSHGLYLCPQTTMTIDLVLKNYRCFPDRLPTALRIQPGMTALVGKNNSGKSSVLKFLYEFRDLFRLLSTPSGNFRDALGGRPTAFRRGLLTT